jgi:hypothetical protein
MAQYIMIRNGGKRNEGHYESNKEEERKFNQVIH